MYPLYIFDACVNFVEQSLPDFFWNANKLMIRILIGSNLWDKVFYFITRDMAYQLIICIQDVEQGN